MPDPYAPKGWPREVAAETRGPLDQFLARLADLGATDDEQADVAATWHDDEAFPPEWRQELLHMGDNELAAMIREVREEHRLGTTTEDDDADAEAHAAYRAAMAEAAERIGGNVQAVLAWVGDDPVRAQAVHQLETGPDGAGRKTLVEPVQQLLDDHAGHNDVHAPTPTGAVSPAAGSEAGSGPDMPDSAATADSDDQGGHSGAAS
jgi:hypothetical protein